MQALAPAIPQPRIRYAAALLHVVELSGRFTDEIAAVAPAADRRRNFVEASLDCSASRSESQCVSRGSLLGLAGSLVLLTTAGSLAEGGAFRTSSV